MKEPGKKAEVAAGPWTSPEPVRRRFSGPADARAALRVDFAKAAWSDVVQHARESLDAEICGVLVGTVCRDDEGSWVEVAGAIRGHAAAAGQAHVTFTHETWDRIHAERESRFPRLAIVGWYHSHPGFGVAFSEMDAFIHSNFFAGPTQLAMVADPVAGREAICLNDAGGITYLERCWVDARERRLETPGLPAAAAGAQPGQGRIDALEARIGQLVGALDDMRNRIWSFYLTVGLVVVLSALMYIGWQVWMSWRSRYEPPEAVSEISVPVRIGDHDVMLLAKVYGWRVPDALNGLIQERIRQELEAEAKARAEAEAKARQAAASATAATTQAGK